jgi:hypothetical protein
MVSSGKEIKLSFGVMIDIEIKLAVRNFLFSDI